mmetsp:Transcript_26367/g.43804  ORF Transcript_26367/g.43804 Transcript_26367/m.43804 type:complete len:448 (+) Transcript_26367:19-1362(+)
MLLFAATVLRSPAAAPRMAVAEPTVVAEPPVWGQLESKLAPVATGFTVRQGLVPSSAPRATVEPLPHGEVVPESVVFYRDTNAWCPFCERLWLYLLESGIQHDQTFVDISPGKKPEWYKEVIPTGQTPSLSLGGKALWESNDIIAALEAALSSGELSGTSLLPASAPARARVLAELKSLDNPEQGLKIGSAGYIYMRGARFGEQPPKDGANLPALREAFYESLQALETRLRFTPGPYLEEAFSVLDIALWPSLERMAAGLPAFRSYDLRSCAEFPAVAAWLKAMGERPAVRVVSSDDGTLVRLFSRVFGMGGAAPPPDGPTHFGGEAAMEAAAKLVRNRARVAADILEHAAMSSRLTPETTLGVIDASLALVASRLSGEPADSSLVASLVNLPKEDGGAAASIVSSSLSFLRTRVSAPRDMSAAAAVQLRAACAVEAATAYDRLGYT